MLAYFWDTTLALDNQNNMVVIELKVSRGYEKGSRTDALLSIHDQITFQTRRCEQLLLREIHLTENGNTLFARF